MAPRRVLMLAESAHPTSQSVSWIGWSLSRAMAERAEVHLVTRQANRQAILDSGLEEGKDFTAIDLEWLEQPILRMAARLRGGADKGWTTLMALSLPLYYAFEREVRRRFDDELRSHAFDIVHRVTPVSPTMPSLIARHCAKLGVPFVLGPINGGLPWPRAFASVRHAENEWLSHVRGLHRQLPGYRSSRAAASAILVGSMHTFGETPAKYHHKCIYIPENGIDTQRFSSPADCRSSDRLRALFIGRLVPYKGCDMVIEAAAPALRSGELELTIVGDGPERPALASMVERLGLGGCVHFKGLLPPDQVAAQYQAASVLLFPSIREFGGGVVLEAMAMGVVPCVIDYGGPGELVTSDTGFKIGLADRASIIADLQQLIARMIGNPEMLRHLAEAARQRVWQLFTWQAKAAQIEAVYDWLLDPGRDKPEFPFLEPKPGASQDIAQTSLP